MARGKPNTETPMDTVLRLLERLEQQGLGAEESVTFLNFLDTHEKALPFIEQYDQGKLEIAKQGSEYVLNTKTARALIESLKNHLSERGKSTPLFGAPNAGSIDGVISGIYQTAYGNELYPSIESKAANLLYLLIKGHCFVDGNKRIAAFLFIWFLDMNGMLYTAPNEPVVSYALLYKLTVFIAESDPKSKDIIVDLVSQILSFSNEVPPESFWQA